MADQPSTTPISMTITLRLDPPDHERLSRIAAARGESVEQTAQRLLLERLHEESWSELTEAEWATSLESMAAEVLPDEEWPAPTLGPP